DEARQLTESESSYYDNGKQRQWQRQRRATKVERGNDNNSGIKEMSAVSLLYDQIIQEGRRRDLEIILLDISPYLLQGLGPRDLRLAHHCLEFGRHWPGLGNSPRSPLPRRIRRHLRGNARRRGGQPPPQRQAAAKVHGPTRSETADERSLEKTGVGKLIDAAVVGGPVATETRVSFGRGEKERKAVRISQ
ncbi:hypothetical protein BHE74_00016277, partial [Ensete ventricosum]